MTASTGSLNTTETEKKVQPLFYRDLQPTEVALNLMESLQLEHDGTLQGIRTALNAAGLQLAREIPPSKEVENRLLLEEAQQYLQAAGFWAGIEPKVNCAHILMPGDCTVQTARRKFRAWSNFRRHAGRDQVTHLLAAPHLLSHAAKQELLSPEAGRIRHNWKLQAGQNVFTEADMFRILFDQSYDHALRNVRVIESEGGCLTHLLQEWFDDTKDHLKPPTRIALVTVQPQAAYQLQIARRILTGCEVVLAADAAGYQTTLKEVIQALLDYVSEVEEYGL